jgi:hypothetical protein
MSLALARFTRTALTQWASRCIYFIDFVRRQPSARWTPLSAPQMDNKLRTELESCRSCWISGSPAKVGNAENGLTIMWPSFVNATKALMSILIFCNDFKAFK